MLGRVSAVLVLALAALGLLLFPASAQTGGAWGVVSMHPPAAAESIAFAVSGESQGGMVDLFAGFRAAVWQGSHEDCTVLEPPGYSRITAMDGLSKVGYLGVSPVRAMLWAGGANTPTDLTPPGSRDAGALAVFGDIQGGSAAIGSNFHAALWRGTPASFHDLNPSGALSSVIRGIDATGQAGDFSLSLGQPHAALWQGTAESVVDLHPAGAYASQAQAISNGSQGGYVQYAKDGARHAALWSGTADSFLDLTPAGGPSNAGAIAGMDGNVQVGNAGFVDGSGGATVWFGTPESAFYLGSLLSSDYTETWAYAVDIDEFGTIRVVGSAYNNNYYLPNGTYYPRYEAMMWVLVPEPSSLAALAAGLAALAKFRWRR